MPPMPTLGPQPRSNPLVKVLAVSVVAGLIVGAGWWFVKGDEAQVDPEAPIAAAPAPEAPAPEAVPGAPSIPRAVAEGLPVEAPAQPAGPQVLDVKIHGPLETAVVKGSSPEVGPALAQVITRSLVWWLSVPRDLMAGDSLQAVYSPRVGEEPLVHAVRFTSGKQGKTLSAFRFHPEGEAFPRFYLPDGQELEERLQHSPLADYEQITSLLRDGRGHKGVDFKVATGAPVMAPFDGVIERRNWNFRSNGNCLELRERGGKGRSALFLHLDELPESTRVGMVVKRGQVIAKSGNSGRSFAPHLHYQLMSGTRVLDPFTQHATFRRKLPAAAQSAFEAEVRRLEALMTPVAAATP